jgi:bifunctional DNA-binding transcriptional regulator/antitoxin component of YhaV-PrlF toxin-antitoxin module
MNSFKDIIKIIGVNPYIVPPESVLTGLFKESGRSAGPIPIRGTLNGHDYIQTLVKFQGSWRLYLNMPMRKAAGIDVGDMAECTVEYDPRSRAVKMPEALELALRKNPKARRVFDSLSPSRQKEINRTIAKLKDPDVVKKNVTRAIEFLCGNGRFAGRDRP